MNIVMGCKPKVKLIPHQFATDLISQLKSDVTYLADDKLEGRLVGTDGEVMAADYCVKRFKEIGLKPMKEFPEYRQRFTLTKKPNPHSLTPTGDFVTQNVVKELINGPKNNNYIFLLFSGEEMGLWGSNYFVKNANIDLSSVNYMFNLDMVGRLNNERTLALNGTGTSPVWKDVLDRNNRSQLKLVKSESGVGPSDHTSFYNNDIPVIHFFTGQHSDYHKPTDDYDKVNYQGISEVVKYIVHNINDLDQRGKIAFSKTNDESEIVPDFKVTLGATIIREGKTMEKQVNF